MAVPSSSYLGFVRDHGRLLAFGFLMTFFSSMGQTYLIALSGGAVREAFDLTVGGFGSLYSAATLASALTLPWIGRLIDGADLGRFAVAVSFGLAAACRRPGRRRPERPAGTTGVPRSPGRPAPSSAIPGSSPCCRPSSPPA